MSRGALFTTPLECDLGASWCAGVIALLKSQSLYLLCPTFSFKSFFSQSFLGHVKDMFSPSWLVDMVKKASKRSPSPSESHGPPEVSQEKPVRISWEVVLFFLLLIILTTVVI